MKQYQRQISYIYINTNLRVSPNSTVRSSKKMFNILYVQFKCASKHLLRIKQTKQHSHIDQNNWHEFCYLLNRLFKWKNIPQTLSATHISKMRFSSKIIARSNLILYVHFTEPGFFSVIKKNALSPWKKNPTWMYNHDIIIHFSAIDSTGKIKGAAIVYHCSFFECITSTHSHLRTRHLCH